MTEVRNSETLIPNGGTGFRFNNEGNQVSYRCDVKKVVTINFDRNKVRKMCADLSKKSDEISGQIDAAVVNTQVAYEALRCERHLLRCLRGLRSETGHRLICCLKGNTAIEGDGIRGVATGSGADEL